MTKENDENKIKISKALAECGVDSRRKCEELVRAGRVKVNGKKVEGLGTFVDPEDVISLDGHKLDRESKVYFAFNKPEKVLSTMEAKDDVDTIRRFFEEEERRLFYAGRLDFDSCGLMIITNDGDFANRVQHPSYGKEKVYKVTLEGNIDGDRVNKASNGITVKGVKYAPFKFKIMRRNKRFCVIKMTINEGKNREIRNIFEHLGYNVLELQRLEIGSVKLFSEKHGSIEEGQYRELNEEEIKSFY